jgi:hypothetical protein
MKWIGQHIWDFISRFRSSVYLEDISDAGSDTDKFLVAESDGKVSYRTGAEVLSDIGAASSATDLSFDGSTANGVLTYKDADEISVESTLTYIPNNSLLQTWEPPSTFSAFHQSLTPTTDWQTGSKSGSGFYAAFDMDRNTASGQTNYYTAFKGYIDDDGTHVGTVDYMGLDLNIDFANTGGTQKVKGVNTVITDCDTADLYGIHQQIEDGGKDLYFLSSDTTTVDYFSLATGASGATTIQTVDGDVAAADLTFTVDGKITMTPADISGLAFHIDADADTDNEVQIDAGLLDVNATGSITIDAADDITISATDNATFRGEDDVTIASTSADGLVTISSAHTAGQAIHIDGDADALSRVEIDAGILDIDVTGVSTIDTTSLTITGKTLMNNRTLSITAGSSAGEFDGDVVYTGTTIGMTAGAPYIYNSSGTWTIANASTEAATKGLLAIALGDESDVDGMLLRGMVTTTTVAGTQDEGAELYLRATPGAISTLAPGSSGQFVRVVGYCMENSNNRIYFNPDNTYIELA